MSKENTRYYVFGEMIDKESFMRLFVFFLEMEKIMDLFHTYVREHSLNIKTHQKKQQEIIHGEEKSDSVLYVSIDWKEHICWRMNRAHVCVGVT